ncbi:MAG: APC family permease [Bdellovibrionota bacterium]
MNYKRDISSLGILCASLSGIIGSGWLFGCLFAAQMAGPASIFSWIIGGVSVLFLALTYAEVSTMFPISGGFATLPVFTHGKLAGFILTWITWVTYVVSIAQEVQATIFYLGNHFPSWVQKQDGVTQFTHLGFFISFLIMLSLLFINSFGAKLFSKANTVVSLWKLFVPFIVVVLFIFNSFHNNNHFLFADGFSSSSFAPYGIHGVFSAVALSGVVYSFCGFQHGAMLAGEAKNPQKAVPMAAIGSIIICILLYCGLQYAFISALPDSALANGWKNLSFVGDAGPLAGLSSMLGLGWLAMVLYVDSVISPLGTGVIYMASSARVVQNMSTTGSMPKFFARLTKFGVPIRAMALNFILAMLAFLPFKGWQSIVSFLSSALVFSFAVGPLCLVAFRKQLPLQHRPFRLPFYQVFSFIAFYVCNLMIFWSGFDVVWKLSVTLAIGAIAFMLSSNKTTRSDFISAVWLVPYMGSFCLLSYYGSFAGGINMIPLGEDFIYVFALSLIFFILSQKMSLSEKECRENMRLILGTER